ncbi:MAG: hypothetical protein SYC29_04770 [Planctomycetota bacterium]|nr:hypothetical protein [Planctomycetota bacterium]
MGIAVAGIANAAEIIVDENIETSTTWTADNTYNLVDQIYVIPGASLTIEAGTIVASEPSENGSGSLAVTRGAQIFVNGTQDAPVIMTSKNDDFETWRVAANEWGNLTIMGDAYISNTNVEGNECFCDGGNISPMEGLVEDPDNPEWSQYGGGNDDDDSGSVSYLSLRYGGRVIGLANELNGMSVGGVGRATEMNHIEIMNNVDDGIETWGGTVNYKYVSIWNIGDDSFDFDQGWRGKAQFGLVVQGYSLEADQGSGVGDNCFEHDGAEDSLAQPVTRATIYNFTAIGQPASGDGAMVWRDGCGVQYRQCIYMDIGERVVRFDNCDGDGAQGYGDPNGPYDTFSFAEIWETPYDVLGNGSEECECPDPEAIYQAQSQGDPSIGQGYIAEVTDSVFFRNYRAGTNDKAYFGDKGGLPCGDGDSDPDGINDGAIAVGVLLEGDPVGSGASNPAKANVRVPWDAENPDDGMPVVALERGDPVDVGGLIQLPVISLDPRAANDALVSEGWESTPDDGFFCRVPYRGAFSPNGNWLIGWSAADSFGFLVAPPCPADFDGNGEVNTADLLYLLGNWGTCAGDVDGDGDTNTVDLLDLLGAWGSC